MPHLNQIYSLVSCALVVTLACGGSEASINVDGGTNLDANTPSRADAGTDSLCALGCTAYTLVSDQPAVENVIVSGNMIYWSQYQVDGAVLGTTFDDDSPIVELAGAQDSPFTLIADVSHVYWANVGGGEVSRVSRAGGFVENLVSGQSASARLAANASHVYWSDVGLHRIARIAKNGGLLQELVSDQDANGLAVDDMHVFWTSETDSSVMRANTSTGIVEELLHQSTIPEALRIDSSHVYWVSPNDGGSLYKIAKNGGFAVQLATGQGKIDEIALDPTHVYWTTDAGYVKRIAKTGGPMAMSRCLLTFGSDSVPSTRPFAPRQQHC